MKKITKTTKVETLRQYVMAHRRLWDWLAKNPMEDKDDWPGWEDNGGTYETEYCYCFMCGITVKLRKLLSSDKVIRCRFCPLNWGGVSCEDTSTPYWRYDSSKFRLDNLSRTKFRSEEEWEQEMDLAVREVQLNAMAVRDLPLKRGICYDVLNKSEGSVCEDENEMV